MSFQVGAVTGSKKEFLDKQGIRSPYNFHLNWSSVPKGFFPVVLTTNGRGSFFTTICITERELINITSADDIRERVIYFVSIEKLLSVAGKEFIEFVKTNNLASDDAIQKALLQEKENLEKIRILLFSGNPTAFGLSNEDALVRACPVEFKKRNDWSGYAAKLFFCGGMMTNWEWKSSEKEEQKKQFACFSSLLSTWGIAHEDKEAVAGWMLSEMLVKVPEHIIPDQEE